MWIKKSEVINHVNDYLKVVTVSDLFKYSRDVKIDIDKKTLETLILEKYASEIPIRLSFYEKFAKALKIYAGKCFKICHILEMIAGVIPFSESIAETLDITIEDEMILESDINRLMRPLKTNYELLLDVKQKAENPETYLDDIDFKMPNGVLLNKSPKFAADKIAMTDKQMKEQSKLIKEMTKEVISKRKGLID